MIDVVNLQRKVKLDTCAFRSYIGQVSSVVSEAYGKTFAVAFVSDKRMTDLNSFFLGKDSTTDVLSFPHETDEFESKRDAFSGSIDGTPEGGSLTFLGDIVISAEQAERQAKENGVTLENEIKQLILHGLLHLCGYDHETDSGEMNRRELGLRKELNI